MGAIDLGKRRLLSIIQKYSLSRVKEAGEELLNYSERMMRKVIKGIPDGIYEFEDFLDSDGVGTRDIPIRVKLVIHDDSATVDFTGTSPQVRGCLNAPLSVTTAAVSYVFYCLAPQEMPLNSGPLRAVEIYADEGSVVNATFPAAVAGGNVETSQRIVDVLLGALAKAIPERIPAASQGSMNNIALGGMNPRTKKPFAYYETIGGGMGGRSEKQGVSAVHTHLTNTLNTPIEALERELPLMIENYSIRHGSGGKGRFRGGDGIRRDYKFLSKGTGTVLSERRRFAPYGVFGGGHGKKGRNILIRDGKSKEITPKAMFDVKKGDTLSIRTPGGGGWGKRERKKQILAKSHKSHRLKKR